MKTLRLLLVTALCVLLSLNSVCLNSIALFIQDKNTQDLPSVVKNTYPEYDRFTARLPDKEPDLNTFVFQNYDGSESMISYGYPVKYIDNGVIKDISLNLEKKRDGSLKPDQYPIDISFPRELNEGISLRAEDFQIKFYPHNEGEAEKTDNNIVSYVCEDDLNYVYTLTYTGFKEEIVLNHRVKKNDFAFTIQTNGLHFADKDGNVVLSDESGKEKLNFGDVLIYSENKAFSSTGKMSYQEIIREELYLLTINVDQSIIDDESLYPLVIDPSVEVLGSSYLGVIEDLTINSDDPVPAGTSGSLYIGKRQTYGKSRVLMKFPNLNLSTISCASNIIDAKVYLRDLMCESTPMKVYCHRFTGNSWSENNSSSNWNNVSADSYYADALDSNVISYSNGSGNSPAHYYGFNITSAVQIWKSNSSQMSKGLIFKASNTDENGSTYTSKTFASYNRDSYKPYIVITYTTDANVHFYNYAERMYIFEVNHLSVSLDHVFSSSVTYHFYAINSNALSVHNAELTQSGYCSVVGKQLGLYSISCFIKTQDYIIDSFYIPVFITLRNDSYFLRNYGSERHIAPVSNLYYEGNTLCQWTFNPAYQVWNISFVKVSNSSSYYTISAVTNGNTYYVGLSGSGSVVLTTNTTVNDVRWNIKNVENDEGYIISPYSDSSKALVVSPAGNNNGVSINVDTYTPDYNYYDEWAICSKKSVSMVVGQDDVPIKDEFDDMQNSFADIGITNVYNSTSYYDYAVLRDEAIDRMRYSKAVFVNGHGSETSVNMHNTMITDSTFGSIYNDDNNAFNMCDLVVYLSCLTAHGGPSANNLCKATLDAGVNTVIGFKERIPAYAGKYWLEKFVYYLTTNWGNQSKSYSEICLLAMNDTSYVYNTSMYYIDNGQLVDMNSCEVFGSDILPSAMSWQ